jgi:hypothetical protein
MGEHCGITMCTWERLVRGTGLWERRVEEWPIKRAKDLVSDCEELSAAGTWGQTGWALNQ